MTSILKDVQDFIILRKDIAIYSLILEFLTIKLKNALTNEYACGRLFQLYVHHSVLQYSRICTPEQIVFMADLQTD